MHASHQVIPWVNLPSGSEPWTREERARVAADVGAACRQGGFFFLRGQGHGLPPDMVDATYHEVRAFFRQPLNEKLRFNSTAETQFLGYRAVGREKSRSHAGAEACEQYRIGHTTRDLGLEPSAEFFHEPFRHATALLPRLQGLGDDILAACAVDLGLGEDYFDSFMAAPMHRLGLNYYKPGQGAQLANPVDYAMSPHIDLSLFTVVTQDQPGLQVRDVQGRWTDVPARPDALFVLLGDYLQRWTNGAYVAATHRVGPMAQDRVSIQYKHRPSYSTVVEPLKPFAGEDNPLRYEPFDTGSQYASILGSLLAEPTTP
ncbi:2OG-Fe(II) oxygenase family protein [Streptomyces sp. CG1]|uniref:2OG-Fe(II) oxygenase family protein n=1 Tax=Streptomyces sp. CG1 TaxID=1287523 RepID=UPI0034E2FFBA